MSLDRREEILVRLFEILQGVTPALVSVVRNRAWLDNDARPAAYLLDGEEENVLAGDRRGRKRMSPGIVALKPQIFVVLKNAQPQNVDVGTQLNEWRKRILTAIANDAQLLSLVGDNGEIVYLGCSTDLQSGMTMAGELQINLSISHAFNPYS